MTIKGIMECSCKFEDLDIGDIFSFCDDRQKIWDSLRNYSSYEENCEKDVKEYEENKDRYVGEELFMLCWNDGPIIDDNIEYAFHPKYISLKDGVIHDIIKEQDFTGYNYYSEVRVYDTCTEIEVVDDEEEM